MRFLTLGSVALLLAGCSGKGDTGTTGTLDCVANPTDPRCNTGGESDTAPPDPECLDANAMTMDFYFGWDGTQTISVNDSAGNTYPSAFVFVFGPAGWTGDTSGPAGPDNWCFVQYAMDGVSSGDTSNGEFVSLSGFGAAVTNCGQESSPGAGDEVTLCPGSLLDTYDPSSFAGSPADWVARIGGMPIAADLADLPAQFAAYGYVEENFWGGELDNPFFAYPLESINFGMKIDDNNIIIEDPTNGPEFWIDTDQGQGTLQPGYYTKLLPWVITFG